MEENPYEKRKISLFKTIFLLSLSVLRYFCDKI